MILTIDIGNSNITIGAYRGDALLFLTRMGTDRSKMPDEYAIAIHSLLRLYGYHGSDLEGAVISSVVPPLSASLKQAITRIKPVRILTVGPGIKTGLHIAIDNPAQLGADLVCVSVAALEKYPLPSIVIDMGTATTISAMDRHGKMLGGSILPGVRISLEALTARTAQLPQIDLSAPPQSVIGANTIDCMKSGVLYGTASMLDGMLERFSLALNGEAACVATGAFAPVALPHCRHAVRYEEHLVLDGLRLLYEKNAR